MDGRLEGAGDETSEDGLAKFAFAADDPRHPPYSDEELAILQGGPTPVRRWIRNRVDELAVRLQYGRGRGNAEICLQFGIGETTLKVHARNGCWSRALSELNRRDLARRVWIAGIGRILQVEDGWEEALARLVQASEWTPHLPPPPTWTPLDSSAHQSPGAPAMTQHQLEKQALLDNPANPDRTHRDRVAANLDRLIARLERQKREKEEQAGATASEGEKAQQ